MAHYRMLDREPSAIITVNGSEKKIYNNGQIFLNDGENFEIRFFNPLQEKIGVEIIFNGQRKNEGLLVLNPGQDVALDRFLEEKKKMKFETYTIDGNNSAAVQAAALNGLVEFKFYKERINNYCYYSNTSTWNSTGSPVFGGYTIRGIVGDTYTSTSDYMGSSTFSSSCCDSNLKQSKSKKIKSLDIETGRVEKGPESNQNLTTVDADFETNAFHTISYQLKPNSQRTTEVTEVRNYCTKCGYRLRKTSWTFCPKCGSPI